jgi:protein subunit release factor A
MRAMLEKLDRARAEGVHRELNGVRSLQVGSGMRGDKRRTYRFRDDQVEDHVTGKRTTCKRIMKGWLEDLW